MKILLATNNPGKVEEMRALLAHPQLTLLTPADLGIDLQVSEDGATYAENAILKARAFATASHLPTLADDSGLEVDALDGHPGVHSHRFAPQPNASDADRCAYLLAQLQGKSRPWRAKFRATLALARPNDAVTLASGHCPGEIIPQARGENGFGYDPIFLVDGLNLTMAELDLQTKNQVSHRARAVKNAFPLLAEWLGVSADVFQP